MIPGTYNGITAHSVYERIHFSGSVNPGMSGGPVLNQSGQVIGVNVATAGNQLGFLVPLNRLTKFIVQPSTGAIKLASIDATIAAQLKANQAAIVGNLVKSVWGKLTLATPLCPVIWPRISAVGLL